MESAHPHPQNRQEAQESTSRLELLRQLPISETPKPEEVCFQIVVVALNKQLYGIRIFSVREILKVKKMTWVPCTPKSIIGVISVRGDIQSVVDLKHLLQIGCSQVTEHSRIILAESQELFVTGLLVDEMLDIIEVPVHGFLPLTSSGISVTQNYIEGNVHWNEKTVALLNIDAIIQGVIVNQT